MERFSNRKAYWREENGQKQKDRRVVGSDGTGYDEMKLIVYDNKNVFIPPSGYKELKIETDGEGESE